MRRYVIRFRWVAWLAAFLLLVSAGVSAADISGEWSAPADLERARAVFVYDGDTIDVMLEGRRRRVRYIGIDTPELSDERPHLQVVAQQAREANMKLVLGRDVWLEWDAERLDAYGRLLAYVYVEPGIFVNGWLVEQGLARTLTIPPNTKYREILRALESEARASGRGVWEAVESQDAREVTENE